MLPRTITTWWANYRKHATLLDRLTAGYLAAFTLGLILLGQQEGSPFQTIALTLVVLILIIVIVVRWGDHASGVTGFIRQLYPGFLYPFFYSQTQHAIHWLIPRFLDPQLVAFERALFGVDPNLWIKQFESPLLNEWIMLGYFSYYLLLPITGLPMFFRGEIGHVRRLLTSCTIAFIISYVGFIVYPLEGPRYYLAGQIVGPLEGWLFVPLVNWIIAGGAIHGGCMPSSHTAVALVVLLWAWRINRRWALVLAPFILTLFVGTVWGRFHYVTDVLVGLPIGWIGFVQGERLYNKYGAVHEQRN